MAVLHEDAEGSSSGESGISMKAIPVAGDVEKSSARSDSAESAVEIAKESRKPPNVEKPISNFDTMIHLLKGNIGTGIFSMPKAFFNSGIWVGAVLLPFMAIVTTHCMQMLIKSAHVMKSREGDFSISFYDVAETACRTGDKKFHKLAGIARKTVQIVLCVTQLGICCIYVVFIGSNLKQVIDNWVTGGSGLDVRVYFCIVGIPLIFINWIRNLKYLAPVSLISNILQAISIIVVFYYIFRDGLPSISTTPAFGGWAGLPLFFATASFTFEGIPLVLPLMKDMKRPQDFPGWTGVLNTGMVIVTCVYVAMGFYGYLKYGENIMGSITYNLPNDETLAQVSRLLLVISVCGNYAMQFYVPIPIMMPTIRRWTSKFIYSALMTEYLFRTFMVLLTVLLAAVIPKIDLFIALVGAIGSTALSLLFPPVLEAITYWPNISKVTITKDVLILIVGLLGFVTGTYSSIRDIVLAFTEESS